MKLSLADALLLTLFLLCASAAALAQATEDPEVHQCKAKCLQQPQFEEEDVRECEQKCEAYQREKREKEEETTREERAKQEGERRSREGIWTSATVDPAEKKLQQCERQEGQQRALCRFRCQQRYGKDEERREEEVHKSNYLWGEEGNPYVFEEEHFKSTVRSEHGRIDLLQRFTTKSELLLGIDQYRVAIIEANPLAFVSPSHLDADALLFVASGLDSIAF